MLSVLAAVLKSFAQQPQHSPNEKSHSGDSRSIYPPNMSDLEDLGVEPQSSNYDGCIVTRQSDGESSFTSVLSLPGYEAVEVSQQPEDNNSDVEVTVEQVEEADLGPEDSYFFMLGLLNRVENYLHNLQEDCHKEWLTTHTRLIKTTLTKNLKCFKESNVKINKTSTKNSKIRKSRRKSERKKGKKVTNRPKTRMQEDISNLFETTETTGGMRRSHRLQQFNQDRELVYCDRMSYISLKLPSSTPFPQIVKRKVKGQTVESKFLLSESPVKKIPKPQLSRRMDRSGGVMKTVKTPNNKKENVAKATSSKRNNRVSNKRGCKSLNVNDVIITRSKAKKRRAVSVDRGLTKKAKKTAEGVTEDSLPQTSSATPSSTTRDKRKLYSADAWLHSFTMMQQASPSF